MKNHVWIYNSLDDLWSQLNLTPLVCLTSKTIEYVIQMIVSDIQSLVRHIIDLLLTIFLPGSIWMMAWCVGIDASSHSTQWSTCCWQIYIYIYHHYYYYDNYHHYYHQQQLTSKASNMNVWVGGCERVGKLRQSCAWIE